MSDEPGMGDVLRRVLDAKDAEIARLTAENAELRKDAERYRWLRPRLTMSDLNGPIINDPCPFLDRGADAHPAYDADIDRTIDAARGEP